MHACSRRSGGKRRSDSGAFSNSIWTPERAIATSSLQEFCEWAKADAFVREQRLLLHPASG